VRVIRNVTGTYGSPPLKRPRNVFREAPVGVWVLGTRLIGPNKPSASVKITFAKNIQIKRLYIRERTRNAALIADFNAAKQDIDQLTKRYNRGEILPRNAK